LTSSDFGKGIAKPTPAAVQPTL
jgi:hypothetical protein